MVGDFASTGFTYLCLAFAALELSTLLDSQCGAAAEVLTPLAALFAAVALIYHHLMGLRVDAVPVVGARRRSIISELVMFALCVSVGMLEFIVFGRGQAAGVGGAGHGARACALGLAALLAMPAAATVTFFCGMMLIVAGVAHVRAGGTGAVAADGPIQALLRVLPKVAAGTAAALVGLMAMAFASCSAKFHLFGISVWPSIFGLFGVAIQGLAYSVSYILSILCRLPPNLRTVGQQ